MRMRMKSLLAFSAALSLAPAVALALPPQCDDWCWMWTCDSVCAVGTRQTTCAENKDYWGCEALTQPNDPSASVSPDGASQVCSEANPAAEQSVTVES